MTSLQVRNTEKLELLRELYQDQKNLYKLWALLNYRDLNYGKLNIKSCLKKFHGDFAFDQIMKVFELQRFELRLYCILSFNILKAKNFTYGLISSLSY